MSNKKEESVTKNLLQNKIVLAVVLAIIIIFAIVAVISMKFIGSYLMDEADIRYQVITDNVAEEITTWFSNEAQIVLNQKAALEIAGQYDPDELTEYLTRIVEDYNEEGYIYDLYFVNTDNVMSSGYGYIPDPSIDFRTRPWYADTLDRDGLFYSAPYKDSNLDRYVVTISTTCYKQDGTLAGVLALDIFVDTLFSIADDRSVDGDSYVFLVDNNMGLATHPNPDYAYVNDEPVLLPIIDKNIYSYVVSFISVDGDVSKVVLNNEITDYDGVSRTVYVSKIDCCGWYAVTAIESSVVVEPLLKTLVFVVVALILCLAVGITLSRIASAGIISQLNKASEEAKMANETKSEFLANMSHEIRTPINAIIGMNEMVIRENNDPVINDYALDIASASRSLVTIVNDILDFSKIESGKMEILEEEFNIASIINDIVNMSESRLGNKELELFFRIDPQIPVGLIGDEIRIKQVILNMMTNAIKYTNTGFVTMRVEFSKQEYGINLNVFVKDSGIGISEENLTQLYQSFRRFDAQRNRSIVGTGLGLSITKRLVTNMGGFINVTSELGVGSEFSFSIPLKVSDAKPFISIKSADKVKILALLDHDSVNVQVRKEARKVLEGVESGLKISLEIVDSLDGLKSNITEETSHILIDKNSYFENEEYFKKMSTKLPVIVLQKRGDAVELPDNLITFFAPFDCMSFAAYLNNKRHLETSSDMNKLSFKAPTAKVLIVDDNAMNLKVAAGLMNPYSMKITTVDSGIKAIEILKEEPNYDVVFMDHMMPIMDGIEATSKIRELNGEYYKKLPIIALTANTINNAKKMFMDAGFDDFLAKPINIGFLDRVLRDYIPEEKKIVKESEESDDASSEIIADDKGEDVLIDYSLGLNYTAGNVSLYQEILKEYVENSSEMRGLIKSYFDDNDWANYVIKVHALKSTSLTIGASSLSELAKELELSGKACNYAPIMEKTELLLNVFDEVVKEATKYLLDKGVTLSLGKNDKADKSDISEIDREIARKYATEILEAISEFDVDKVEEIYERVSNEGEEYGLFFRSTIEYVRNFEYDRATEEVERRLEE